MGIAKLQPEPMIEHLVKGRSQPWEHRWKQLAYVTGTRFRPSLTSFKDWLPPGRDLYLEISLLEFFKSLDLWDR